MNNKQIMSKNIIKKAIIIPYFGKWPEWFDLYLYSLGNNPSLNAIFFTDISTKEISFIPENAKFVTISFRDYCMLASEKLGIRFSPSNPYKLCDLRPFYPIIHQEELKEYDYIGWGDIDLIYGNMEKFFSDSIICKYEIISTHSYIFSGHFTLIKNISSIYDRFKNIPNWRDLLSDDKNHCLDEISLSYFMTPKLKYARYIYDRSGGFCGTYRWWAVALMESLARLFYPRYYLREMWTSPNDINDGVITYNNGRIINNKCKELPYIHFYHFKKPNYKTNRTDYWKDDFYQVNTSVFNANTQIIIDKKGIRSR